MLWFRKKEEIQPSNKPSAVDYETDSVRFLYDAYVEEYQIIYDVICARMDIEDRTENYLFLVISAILSIIPISIEVLEPVREFSTNFPFIYVLLAIVSMIFPFKFLQQNILVTNLSNYLRFVLGPKLNAIVEHVPQPSEMTRRTRHWEQAELPSTMHGVFKYENYITDTLFTGIPIVGAIALFRYVFVCTPSVALFSFFLLEKRSSVFWQGWTTVEQFTSILFVTFLLMFVVGVVLSIRGLTRLG